MGMIRTKELTEQHTNFLPKLIEWVRQYLNDEYAFSKDGLNRDVSFYKATLEKIQIIGEYTLEEADILTTLTKIYKRDTKEELHILTSLTKMKTKCKK